MSASSIKSALNYLNQRIDELEKISINCEKQLCNQQIDMFSDASFHANENMIDKDIVKEKLDKTIETVEKILKEG